MKYQVTFSDQSISELNKLTPQEQMVMVELFSNITDEQLKNPSDSMGKFTRNGKDFYRLRAGQFRIYFTHDGSKLITEYLIPHHTLTDFIFRFKLPVSEEQMVEQHHSFWKYLDSLRK